MGRVLADYLLEWLPFEQEHRAMVEIVQLVLQPGLLDEEARLALWRKARQRNSYYVGFLRAVPDALPEAPPPHPALPEARAALGAMAQAGNPSATMLLRLLEPAGQAFLATVEAALRRPADQEVVILLFEAVEAYFAPLRGGARATERDPEAARSRAAAWIAGGAAGAPSGLAQAAAAAPGLAPRLEALAFLAQVGEAMLDPIFGRTDAVGSVMRKRLEPVTAPLRAALRALSA